MKTMHGKGEDRITRLPITLPHSRGLLAATVGALILCFIFFHFYGGYHTLGLLGFAMLGILYYAQDVVLYFPDLPANSRVYIPIPTTFFLPYETISIRTPDKVTLHAFWVAQSDISRNVPTFVYLHGNAGNMGHRMQNVFGMYQHLVCNILMVEYRGYGLSTGTPSERGLATDARAAVDYLYTRCDLDHTKIVVFGRSLGGAVAIDVAADMFYGQRIMCAIVENTFTSIPEMAAELVHPSAKYIPNLFYKNKFQSLFKISKCTVPILFISGLADNLVPPRMMRDLYTKCGSDNKYLLEFIGGSHNDTWMTVGYYEGVHNFLVECRNIERPLQPFGKNNVWHEIQDV